MISVDSSVFEAVSNGTFHDPHALLGSHPSMDAVGRPGTIIRAHRPAAETVTAVLSTGMIVPLDYVSDGIWEGLVTGTAGAYVLQTIYEGGTEHTAGDPYRHAPTIGEDDLRLIEQGHHERLWNALGAHPRVIDGDAGCAFTVWAPNATAVRVVGDHNGWTGELHPMRSMGDSGVWELFVPGVAVGNAYMYEILTPGGRWIRKADPVAQQAEVPPATASVVTRSEHLWHDGAWMTRRAATHAVAQPLSVYELHPGSWRPGLGYREIAEPLIAHVIETGFTHVEFMPLAEHPHDDSWGYKTSAYYAPTQRYGHPDDLRFLIDELHQAGIGVILDWVPGHFARGDSGLARFDGHSLYEHFDPQRNTHQDADALVFDYGRPEVRNFLIANALYWLDEFHIDGLRVSGVAEMLYLGLSPDTGEWQTNIHGGREDLEAIRFIQEVNTTTNRRHPGILMVAEETTSFPGVTAPTNQAGLGFAFKWNTGWKTDSLDYMRRDPQQRAYHQGEMTFSFVYAFGENYMLPISHDDVSRGKGSLWSKMPGPAESKLANLRAYLAYMWAHPGKKLMFMGQEFGEVNEWLHKRGVDWQLRDELAHSQLQSFVGTLNRTYRAHAPLWERDNDGSSFARLGPPTWDPNVVAFCRRDAHGGRLVSVSNFSNSSRQRFALDLPSTGSWQEVLNTDATEHGGGGTSNLGYVYAQDGVRGTSPHVTMVLPALSTIWLRYQRDLRMPAPVR